MATGIGGGISAGDAVWTITGDSSGLQQSLAQAEGAVTTSTANIGASMLKVGAGMTAMGGMIVGSLGVAVKSWAEMGGKIRDASVQTGIGAEALSGLSYAAELSGSNLEGIVGAINKMQRGLDGVGDPAAAFAANLDAIGISFATWEAATPEQQMQLVYDSLIQAANGAGQVAVGLDGIGLSVDKFFKMSPSDQYVALSNAIGELQPKTDAVGAALMRLGINTSTFMSSAPDQQFLMIAEAISQIEDPTARTALAMDIFGRSGASLIPLLAEGSDGITRMMEEAKKLGITFTDETAARAEAFGDTMDKLKFSFMGVMNQIGPMVADMMEKLVPAMVEGVAKTVKWIQDNEALVSGLIKFGAVVGGILTVIGPVLVAIGSLIYAFSGIMSAVAAVSSVIAGLSGAFATVAAAVAAAAAVLAAPITLAAIAVGLAVSAVIANWEGIKEGLDVIWDAIKWAAGSVVDFLGGIWDGIVGVFTSGWQWIQDILAQIAGAVGGLFGGIGDLLGLGGSTIEARASGGPVNSGQPYLVGEEGPELFVPNGSGTIMPNGAAGGGASVTINLGGVSVRSEADIRNLSERLAEVTARELRAAGAYA
jgi:hypothetical protein